MYGKCPSRQLLAQVPKRSGLLWKRIVHKEPGLHIAEEMLLEFAESGHPTFRATTSFSRCKLKSKGHGKLSLHFAADPISSVCTEQSRKCVKNMNPLTADQAT